MKRVMIIGQPGSGKSTLAREIGAILSLPVVHIDHIHWQSGWAERPRDEKTLMCRDVHAREAWVFEGGHSVTWPERAQRCDMLIWLDLPIHIRLPRVFFRSLRYWGRTRPDLPDGCPEQFDGTFYRWIWDTRRSGRSHIERFMATVPPEKLVFRLKTPDEAREFLNHLRSAGHVGRR